MPIFNPLCGWFPSVRTDGTNKPLLDCLEEVRSGTYRKAIETIRNTSDEDTQQRLKRRLPAVMFSASTVNGRHREADVGNHTGLLQCDVDHLDNADAACALRDRLRDDPHAFAAWLSPRGHGVKCLIKVPPNLASHRDAFLATERWFQSKHNVKIDPQCKDPCRLCFVSYDPSLWVHESAQPLGLIEPVLATSQQGDDLRALAPPPTQLPSATSLPATSYILHNSLFTSLPGLTKLFKELVMVRFPTMQPGLRNEALCELVPLLYSAINPQFIPAFAEAFYHRHREVFRDPLQQHLEEASCLLKGCERDFARTQLSDEERAAYEQCPDERHRTVFRICHSLAICPRDDCPSPFFFLSAEKLGHRLGCFDMQAWRILHRWFLKQQVIAVVAKGERRTLHIDAKATRYQWLLPSKLVTGTLPHERTPALGLSS